jgi:hypothetical protein
MQAASWRAALSLVYTVAKRGGLEGMVVAGGDGANGEAFGVVQTVHGNEGARLAASGTSAVT